MGRVGEQECSCQSSDAGPALLEQSRLGLTQAGAQHTRRELAEHGLAKAVGERLTLLIAPARRQSLRAVGELHEEGSRGPWHRLDPGAGCQIDRPIRLGQSNPRIF
jgi:hypothetical protein